MNGPQLMENGMGEDWEGLRHWPNKEDIGLLSPEIRKALPGEEVPTVAHHTAPPSSLLLSIPTVLIWPLKSHQERVTCALSGSLRTAGPFMIHPEWKTRPLPQRLLI